MGGILLAMGPLLLGQAAPSASSLPPPLRYLMYAGWFVGFFIVLAWLIRKIGVPCPFCPSRRLTPLTEMPSDERAAILDFYLEVEQRRPNPKKIFVCRRCRHVFDDRSPLAETWDSSQDYQTTCRVCACWLNDCGPDHQIFCPQCGTPYAWCDDPATGYRFLMVLPEEEAG